LHARGHPLGGKRGKISELRREAREDLSVAAACLLAALGQEGDDTQTEPAFIRSYTGALLLAEGLVELRNIRKLLTHKE
jgi:hypothetical protein